MGVVIHADLCCILVICNGLELTFFRGLLSLTCLMQASNGVQVDTRGCFI